MSELGDLIINSGPYAVGQRMSTILAAVVDRTQINGLRDELIQLRAIAAKTESDQGRFTVDEWRVTGKRRDLGPAVDQVIRGEDAARAWAAKVPARLWTDGPHLHRRTVTVTEWEAA